jgi:hypothetical protein
MDWIGFYLNGRVFKGRWKDVEEMKLQSRKS